MPTFGLRFGDSWCQKCQAYGFSLGPLVSGFRRARLPAIGFVESTDDFAFSFVDPANVVHGCHLIPAFDTGRSADLLPWPGSVARRFNPEDTDDSDWLYFYVNM